MFSTFPPPLTHTGLHTELAHDRRLYSIPHDASLHIVLRNARLLEVYHVGITLCDAHMGSPYAIQSLVLTRAVEILQEVAVESSESSVWGGKVELEEGHDETFGYAKQHDQQQEQEQISDAENIDPGPELNTLAQHSSAPEEHQMQNRLDQDSASSSQSSHHRPRSNNLTGRPLIRASHTIEYEKPPIIIYEDPPSPPPRPSRPPPIAIAPRPPRSTAPTPEQATGALADMTFPLSSPPPLSPKDMSFQQVSREFQHALEGYNAAHGPLLHSIDEYEIREALKDGIMRAEAPEQGVTPETLWNEVERNILKSARMEQERRDRIEEVERRASASADFESEGDDEMHD